MSTTLKSEEDIRDDQAHVAGLADELASLASSLFAGEARFVALIGEFDRLDGWADGTTRSCAHWLNWRLGIAMPAARERVRVARRLSDLPAIAAAFGKGRLSYSKVRALTRVATQATEATLLGFALCATAAQLERICSTWRRVQAQSEPDAAAAQRGCQELSLMLDDDGSLLIRGRLPTEVGVIVAQALAAAAEMLYRRDTPAGPDLIATDAATEPAAARQTVVGQTATDSTGPGPTGAEQTGAAQTATDSTGGVSTGTGQTGAGQTGAGQTRDADQTAGSRRVDALRTVAESFLASGPTGSSSADHWQVVVHADADDLAAARDGQPARPDTYDGEYDDSCDTVLPDVPVDPYSRPPLAQVEGGLTIPNPVLLRLVCDATLRVIAQDPDGTAVGVGRRGRAIPGWLRRLLYDRDPSCQFPGCANWRWTDGHHVIHWAHGGSTDLDNLIRLCRAHHTIVHNQGVGIATSLANRAWTFHRTDGSLIEPVPNLPGSTPEGLPAAGASVSQWEGDPARLSLIIDGLLQAQEQHDGSAETSDAPECGHQVTELQNDPTIRMSGVAA